MRPSANATNCYFCTGVHQAPDYQVDIWQISDKTEVKFENYTDIMAYYYMDASLAQVVTATPIHFTKLCVCLSLPPPQKLALFGKRYYDRWKKSLDRPFRENCFQICHSRLIILPGRIYFKLRVVCNQIGSNNRQKAMNGTLHWHLLAAAEVATATNRRRRRWWFSLLVLIRNSSTRSSV